MDKQSYQIPNRNTSFVNPRTFGLLKLSIPEKKISNDLIVKLFSEVASGNYLKLKEFLLANQLSMTSKSDTGETVLHLIISNSNITQKEKLQLAILAIKEGAGVNLANDNNVTPLHLACRYQLYDIIVLLLENGAVIDFSDSQFKTPLHYAISGESIQCLSEDDTKVKSLIPKSHIKTKEIESNSDIIDLQTNLKNFLAIEPHARRFVTHIKNTFDNVENMYPFDFKKMISSTQEIIAGTITDTSLTGDKSKIIFEKVMADKKKMLDFVISKVSDGAMPLEIKPGIYEGWGPNQYQANRVLKYRELAELLVDIHLSADNEIQETNIEAAMLQTTINAELSKLHNATSMFSNVIQYSHYYCKVIGRHINNLPMQNLTALHDLLFTQDPTRSIDSPIIQYPGKIFPNYVLGNIANTHMVKPAWDQAARTEIVEINPATHQPTIYLTLSNMRTMGTFNAVGPGGGPDYFLNQKMMPRISDEEYEHFKAQYRNLVPEEGFLTEEFLLNIGPQFVSNPRAMPGNQYMLTFNNVLMHTPAGGVENQETRGLYFDTTTKIFVSLIELLNGMFRASLNDISTQFSEKRFDEAYVSINQCLMSALSMLLTVSEINKEIPIMRDHFNRLKQFFDNQKQPLITTSGPGYGFLAEQICNEIQNVVSDHVDTLNELCNSFYGVVIGVIKLLNRYLSAIQKSSVATIFDSYYKANDFDTWYDTQDCELFEHIIVDNPIEPIPELPNNLIDFRKLKSEIMGETKKTLLTRFVPQISLNNLISFYKPAVHPVVNVKPQLGFIQLFVNNANPITDPYVHTPLEAVRTIDVSTGLYRNNLQIKELEREHPAGTSPFTNANPASLIGYIGIKNVVGINKIEAFSAVAGSDLNVHLVMLRYSIVRKVITQIYDYLDYLDYQANPAARLAPPLPLFIGPEWNALRTSIVRIKTQIESLVPFEQNNYSFLFVLVGKYIDEVLINIINEFIKNKINKIALRLLETNARIPQSYIDKFNNADVPNVVFPNKDTGFNVDMNKLFNDTLREYTKTSFMMSKKMNLITAGDLNDLPKKESNVVKLINFNYTINSIEKACFKVDPKIVKLLLSKGAYVNSKDIIGNAPIYYAIEMQNKEVIDILLDSGAVVYNQRFDNKFGKNILDNTWENYASIVNTLMANKYTVCDTLTQNLLDKFSRQGNYKNNIPKYSDILLSVSLYMLNHQLYMFGKGYPNKWSFKKNTELEQLLQLDTSQVLPLLDDMHITDTEISRLEVPNLYIRQLEKTIDENKEKIKDLTRKKKNMVDEQNVLRSTNARNRTDNEKARLREIIVIDTDIQNQITALNVTITNDSQMLNRIKTTKTTAHNRLKNFISTNKHRLARSQDKVSDTYESVFKNVINSGNRNIINNIYDYSVDIKTYPMIWKKFMQETKNALANCNCQLGFMACKHDYTQILDNIFCYQQKILSDNRASDIKLSSLNIIVDYYDNVICSFATDYFDLPREYNPADSYALSHIIDIIVHIIKRFVFTTLFGTILKALTNYIIMEFPYSTNNTMYESQKKYIDYILNLIVNVVNDNGDGSGRVYGSRLLKYIFVTMPFKIVKVVLQIFEGPDSESDQDRQTSIEQIFDHINKILESTTSINLSTSNTLTSGLKQYVFPYYGDYLELFIKEMFNLISNYLRSLQHQTKTLKILQSVTLKASQEMARQTP